MSSAARAMPARMLADVRKGARGGNRGRPPGKRGDAPPDKPNSRDAGRATRGDGMRRSASRGCEASGSPWPPSWRQHGDSPRSAGPTARERGASGLRGDALIQRGAPGPHGGGPQPESASLCAVLTTEAEPGTQARSHRTAFAMVLSVTPLGDQVGWSGRTTPQRRDRSRQAGPETADDRARRAARRRRPTGSVKHPAFSASQPRRPHHGLQTALDRTQQARRPTPVRPATHATGSTKRPSRKLPTHPAAQSGATQAKLAASSMLPVPRWRATCG